MRKRSTKKSPAGQGSFLSDGPEGNPADSPAEPEAKAPAKKSGGKKTEAPSLDKRAGAMADMGQDEPRKPRRGDANVDAVLDPEYKRIVDVLFDLPDPFEVEQRVREGLSFQGTKASRAEYGTLIDALDEAEELTRQAMKLVVNAKEARDLFEMDARIVMGALREAAQSVLMEEYRNKQRRSPTNDDIEGYIATHHADEYRDIETRRARARRMCEYLEDLHRRSASRAIHLRDMVKGSRG